MSQIEKVRQPKQLFKYAIDRHIALDKAQRLHFYRNNRWRFNTFNRFNWLKTLKLKGPITASIIVGIALDYTINFYSNPVAH